MNKTKLHVRFYADSLGLPRTELNINNEDRYISIVNQYWENKYASHPEILDRARGNMSIIDIYRWFNEDCWYFGNDIDISIIHNGIVDCAPRPIPKQVRRVIAILPQFIQKPIIKLLHNNRALLLKLGMKFHVTSSGNYYRIYKQLIEKAIATSKIVYIINIAPTNSKIEYHSPGLMESINKYNSIINNIIDDLKDKNIILIDINSYISSTEFEIDELVNPEDGHHITKMTHKILANMIINFEDLRK